MLRSTPSFLKRAAAFSRPPLSTVPRRALPSPHHARLLLSSGRAISTNASSSPSDYDRATCAAVADFSSFAVDAGAWSPPSPRSPVSSAAVTSQVPSGMGAAPRNHDSAMSSCYRCIDEPTGCEDYDTDELHHPPCEKTQETYTCCGTSYDPDDLEVGGETAGIM